MLVVEQRPRPCGCDAWDNHCSFPGPCGGRERHLPFHSKPRPRKPRPSQRRRPVTSVENLPNTTSAMVPLSHRPTGINFLPLPFDSEMTPALQYYFEVFKCHIHPYGSDAPKQWTSTEFSTDLLQSAMSDQMWFCANIAFSEALKERALDESCHTSDLVAKYQSKAFKDLGRRLVSDPDNDILLFTITILMSIDILYGDYAPLKMHAEGLDRTLQVRGGLESLNHLPYLKHKVIGFQHFWLSKQISYGTAVATTAEYPRHPFPPNVCISISKLPKELTELALTGILNVELLRFAGDIAALQARFDRDGRKSPEDLRRLKILAYETESVFRLEGLNQMERLVCAALVDYATSMDTDRASHWLLACVIRVRISPIWRAGVKWEKKHSKVLIWIGAVLSTCSEVGALTWRFGTDLLRTCSEHETLDRDFTIRTCKQFIWDDSLTAKLEQKFDFETTPSIRAASSKSPSPLNLPSREASPASAKTG